MSGANRIAGHGGLTSAKTINFTFDGVAYEGLEGDTLASALLANGIHLVGRSFKYHRPRGIISSGSEEPNAIMGISRDAARMQPNVRAPVQELYDGLQAVSQNRWPSLSFDVGAINDYLSAFFPAGFYYKTFKWPAKAWDALYEPVIRRAAGLGVAPDLADPDHYSNRFVHADLLIIGGGIAGLSAAIVAAKSGKSIILCDENPKFGGGLLSQSGFQIDGASGAEWAEATIAELRQCENVRLLNRTTGFGYFNHNMVALNERVTDHLANPGTELPRERMWQVRAKKVIIATGAIERPMVFADNDRPGIMQASAAQNYLNRYGVAVGAKIGVYTSCDSAYAAAFDLKRAGIDIPALVDSRESVDATLLDAAKELNIPVMVNHWISSTAGRLRVNSMTVESSAGRRKFDIDALITSSGWTPSLHLFSQSRGKVAWNAEAQNFLPGTYVQECRSIGSCNGTFDVADAISEAREAAHWAVGGKKPAMNPPKISDTVSQTGGMLGSARGAGHDDNVKAFVDYQNDVTAKDIRLAVREGFHSIEHVKRFTTTGMATDQGKTSNLHGMAIAAEALGKDIPDVGLTTFRPPFTPVTFGSFVSHGKGELFHPIRKTPMYSWAAEQGAMFEPVGDWQRAWYFPKAGEDMHQAVNRECKSTREVAGIFDATTLGKIEVVGPDAAEFMNRIYTNSWTKMPVGRAKYGIMCREDGFIYDDGVVGRIAENRFHVTTTTGGAPRVLNHMEDYLQTEFPDLKVYLTSVSEQWATIAINGPKAREIIAPFIEDIDISPEAMPHMSVREGHICGIPTRLFRISFTGELGFEINVPADFGRSVWEAVYQHGAAMGMVPYGTEAMHVLRAEKGYIIVGQDTDGTVTPLDAGLSWAIAKSKPDFVGKRGLARPDLQADGRLQLVGLKNTSSKTVLEEGAQVTRTKSEITVDDIEGFVTSSYWSANMGHPFAMALVRDGFARMGETLSVPLEDEVIEVEICETVFIDKEGTRVNG